jgi:hypothetical protein
VQFTAVALERDEFNFRAAKIDSDSDVLLFFLCARHRQGLPAEEVVYTVPLLGKWCVYEIFVRSRETPNASGQFYGRSTYQELLKKSVT